MNSEEIMMMSRMADMSDEEREFAEKYWASKTITFEPVDYEIIMKDLENAPEGQYCVYDDYGITIDFKIDKIMSQIIVYTSSPYLKDDWSWNLSKENYIEAVKYAKKLFLGDGENE